MWGYFGFFVYIMIFRKLNPRNIVNIIGLSGAGSYFCFESYCEIKLIATRLQAMKIIRWKLIIDFISILFLATAILSVEWWANRPHQRLVGKLPLAEVIFLSDLIPTTFGFIWLLFRFSKLLLKVERISSSRNAALLLAVAYIALLLVFIKISSVLWG